MKSKILFLFIFLTIIVLITAIPSCFQNTQRIENSIGSSYPYNLSLITTSSIKSLGVGLDVDGTVRFFNFLQPPNFIELGGYGIGSAEEILVAATFSYDGNTLVVSTAKNVTTYFHHFNTTDLGFDWIVSPTLSEYSIYFYDPPISSINYFNSTFDAVFIDHNANFTSYPTFFGFCNGSVVTVSYVQPYVAVFFLSNNGTPTSQYFIGDYGITAGCSSQQGPFYIHGSTLVNNTLSNSYLYCYINSNLINSTKLPNRFQYMSVSNDGTSIALYNTIGIYIIKSIDCNMQIEGFYPISDFLPSTVAFLNNDYLVLATSSLGLIVINIGTNGYFGDSYLNSFFTFGNETFLSVSEDGSYGIYNGGSFYLDNSDETTSEQLLGVLATNTNYSNNFIIVDVTGNIIAVTLDSELDVSNIATSTNAYNVNDILWDDITNRTFICTNEGVYVGDIIAPNIQFSLFIDDSPCVSIAQMGNQLAVISPNSIYVYYIYENRTHSNYTFYYTMGPGYFTWIAAYPAAYVFTSDYPNPFCLYTLLDVFLYEFIIYEDDFPGTNIGFFEIPENHFVAEAGNGRVAVGTNEGLAIYDSVTLAYQGTIPTIAYPMDAHFSYTSPGNSLLNIAVSSYAGYELYSCYLSVLYILDGCVNTAENDTIISFQGSGCLNGGAFMSVTPIQMAGLKSFSISFRFMLLENIESSSLYLYLQADAGVIDPIANHTYCKIEQTLVDEMPSYSLHIFPTAEKRDIQENEMSMRQKRDNEPSWVNATMSYDVETMKFEFDVGNISQVTYGKNILSSFTTQFSYAFNFSTVSLQIQNIVVLTEYNNSLTTSTPPVPTTGPTSYIIVKNKTVTVSFNGITNSSCPICASNTYSCAYQQGIINTSIDLSDESGLFLETVIVDSVSLETCVSQSSSSSNLIAMIISNSQSQSEQIYIAESQPSDNCCNSSCQQLSPSQSSTNWPYSSLPSELSIFTSSASLCISSITITAQYTKHTSTSTSTSQNPSPIISSNSNNKKSNLIIEIVIPIIGVILIVAAIVVVILLLRKKNSQVSRESVELTSN